MTHAFSNFNSKGESYNGDQASPDDGFSSRGQVSFLKVKKNLFRRESSRSNEAIIVNWTNCHPLEVPSGRTRTFRSLFDRNPPVINLRRSESFRRIYRSWHRWPAVNLRLAGGDKEREREKKAANVFFFLKLEKGGIKISGRGRQRWANSIIGK